MRQLNLKNITRLIRIYKLKNCLYFNLNYHVSKVIDLKIFNQALIVHSIFSTDLKNLEELDFILLI